MLDEAHDRSAITADVNHALLLLHAGSTLYWAAGGTLLLGAIRPGNDFDRAGMVGHAHLWDPLFALWGIAALIGLWHTRKGAAPVSHPRRRTHR